MFKGKRALPRFEAVRRVICLVPRSLLISLVVLCCLGTATIVGFKSAVRLPPSYPLPDAEVFLPPAKPFAPSNSAMPFTSDTPISAQEQGSVKTDLVYRILLAVTDQDNYNTDALMIANINCTAKTVDIVSIPRDTYVESASRTIQKINGAYAGKNAERLLEETAYLLGFTPEYYIIVSMKGVEKMVDLIGGVTFNVPRNMNYDDPTQNLSIHFTKGERLLSGADAVKVLRYRHDNDNKTGYSDLRRIEVAQDFMKTYAKQMLSLANFLKLPDLPGIAEKSTNSNLTWGQMFAIALELREMDADSSITLQTLPTEAGSKGAYDYLFICEDEALEMVRSVFTGS